MNQLAEEDPFEPDYAKLIPVSEWKFHRYRVSTDTHLEGSIEDRWPGAHARYYTYTLVAENVRRPAPIGQLYGRPIYGDGWER